VSVAIAAATGTLILAGTLVTGSGPHAGDSAEVPRMGFDWIAVTLLHAGLGTAVLVLAIAQVALLRGPAVALARRRAVLFLAVVIAQTLLGATQSLTGLPELMVALHLLGSALVWVGAIRVLLDVNPTLFRGAPAAPPVASGAEDPRLVVSGSRTGAAL
jgi:heme a synthase